MSKIILVSFAFIFFIGFSSSQDDNDACCSSDMFCDMNKRVRKVERELKKEINALKSQISNPSGKPAIIFDAYRTSSFTTLKSIINYNGLYVNEGGAMNASSGIFKAPFNGIYEFNFHGTTNWLSVANDHIRVRLTVNNAWKTMAHGDKTHTHLLFISAIFELKQGDQVACYLEIGGLVYDDRVALQTQFTGKLLLAK